MNSCYEKRRELNRVAISSTEEGDIACYAEASVASPSSALRNEERLDPKQLALRAGLDGIAGLTLAPTRHQLILDGQGLYTWCAIDAVGIPAALSLDAHVTTSCAHCGAALSVDIDHSEPPADSSLRGWIPSTDCMNTHAELYPPLANLFCWLEHLEEWRAAWGDLVKESEHV